MSTVVIDDKALNEKIDRLFRGQYAFIRTLGNLETERTFMNAIESFDELLQWAESEFGLSQSDRLTLTELKESFKHAEKAEFTREDLFMHLKGIEITITKQELL